MILSEIKSGMVLKHISDVNFERPQKLIVIIINKEVSNYPVYCEWISRDGKIQKEWLNPLTLEKW